MKQNQHNLEEELIERLKRGDTKAYEIIFDRYWFDLYSYAEKKIRSSEDAEELVQTLFLELWEKKEKLIITNLNNFLKVCLRNKCIDFLRAKILEGKYSDYCKLYTAMQGNTTENTIYLHDLSSHIDQGLSQLPEKSQLIFRLSRFEGLSVKETAAKVNLSEKAVEYHLTKALKVIKGYLREYTALLLLYINF